MFFVKICRWLSNSHRTQFTKTLNLPNKSIEDILTDGVPMLVPRQSLRKPYKIYVDSIESDSLEKAEYFTKTVTNMDVNSSKVEPKWDHIMKSFSFMDKTRNFKENLAKSILFDAIPPLLDRKSYNINTNQKFTCNLYRENRFIIMEFTPEFIVRSTSSKLFFTNKAVCNKDINIFRQSKSFLAPIKPNRLIDRAGYTLEARTPSKRNRYKEYIGPIPIIHHPHLILIKSQSKENDQYGNVYCPVSHSIKVAFSALSTHILEHNRSLDRGTGWGYIYGQNIPTPQSCHVIVLCNEYYITLKYQLNTLQMFNNKGIWNEAEYSSKKYYSVQSENNFHNMNYLISFLHSAFQ